MSTSLLIVESPTKAKTIKKYLGKGFQVKATVGHIRDLPRKTLGVDLERDFAPTYETIKGKKKVIDDLVQAALKSDQVYLAPDPDREGEAIAWHMAEAIKAAAKRKKKSLPQIHRVLFHEITARAVKEAVAAPLEINSNLYEAQQARRILDRLVGYQVSPLLWDKVRRGLSAGRVQSVALRIICEREAEIAAFNPVEYWSLVARLSGNSPPPFEAKLIKWKGEKPKLDNAAAVQVVVDTLSGAEYRLVTLKQRERRRNSQPPFITSTLQQEASRKLGFSAKKTMMLAQRLYEGMEVGGEGQVGLITYMRTDSVRTSDQALADVRAIIKQKYGGKYLPAKPIIYKNRKKGVQDAHEAIRPTMLEYSPESVRDFVERDIYRLYDLIWKRFLASQMSAAVFDQTTLDIQAGHDAVFRATGSVMKFDGFIAVYMEGSDDSDEADEESNDTLPALKEGEVLSCSELLPHQHFTQPPPRFSEASLVRELEARGIGRPSTYAAILSNLQDRGYIEKEKGRFFAVPLGKIVNTLLVENFPDIFNVDFTARMENELDEVEEGKLGWISTLRNFYEPFSRTLEQARVQMRDIKRQEIPTEIKCEKCESVMVIKWGRHGEFLACSRYPDCKTTTDFKRVDGSIVLAKAETTDLLCPKCKSAMLVKKGRYGRFLACSSYPECKTTAGFPIGVSCPQDGGAIVEKRSGKGKIFYSCDNYPACKYAIWDKPIAKPCPQCDSPILVEKYSKRSGTSIRCPRKECGYVQAEAETETSKADGE